MMFHLLVLIPWAALALAAELPQPSLRVGTGSCVINNELGRFVQGAGKRAVATRIRDDLEANALYLSDGTTEILLVSCDIGVIPQNATQEMRAAVAAATGIPGDNVILTATHTHSGPNVTSHAPADKPQDLAYLDRLRGWVVQVAGKAKAEAMPGRISYAVGQAQIGWNRRVCRMDGTHTMFGNVAGDDFAGLEGPVDPSHLAIFAESLSGDVKAVLYNNATHPVCFYGADFYSADFPGEARAALRKAFGAETAVLYLNGAQGDLNNGDLLSASRESPDQRVLRLAAIVVGETLRLRPLARTIADPILVHIRRELTLPVQLPTAEQLAWARMTLARKDKGEDVPHMQEILAFGTELLQQRYGDRPTDSVVLHVLRIGDLALATQPAELYCQFGLDIKRRSPFPVTGVVGLADGDAGYIPTAYGRIGGGYSGQAIEWTRFTTEAGYRLVDNLCAMLYEAKQKHR